MGFPLSTEPRFQGLVRGRMPKFRRRDEPDPRLWAMGQRLAAEGQGHDDLVAHINAREALLLRALGGAGTRNRRTGLLQFDDTEEDNPEPLDDTASASPDENTTAQPLPDPLVAQGTQALRTVVPGGTQSPADNETASINTAEDTTAADETAPQQTTSDWGETLHGLPDVVANSATFGLSDYSRAATLALEQVTLGKLRGEPVEFGTAYDANLAAIRASREAYMKQHPLLSVTGQVGGMFTPGIPLARAPLAVWRLGKAASAALRPAARAEEAIGRGLAGESIAANKAVPEAVTRSEVLSNTAAQDGAQSAAPVGDLPTGKASDVVKWAKEKEAGSGKRPYNDALVGATPGQVPSLGRTLPNGKMRPTKFDGLDGNVLIERKPKIRMDANEKDQLMRQSQALRENDLPGRWEVPNERSARRLGKMIRDLGITNIEIKVVDQ